MAVISPLKYSDGSDSLSSFLEELQSKHKNEEDKYIVPLIKVINDFQLYGPQINLHYSKKFPPYKKLDDIYKNLGELRTHKCRYFIYKCDKFEWIGLHGYEKQSQDTPKNEIVKAKGEIKQWQAIKKN